MLLKALRMNFAAAAFAFLFILPCLHAAWYDSIYVWIGFSAGAAIALIALAYMAAKLFELQVLEAWVKVELQEIMASMVIVVFCISLIASADSASQFLTGTPSVSQAASEFLKNDVFRDGRGAYMRLAEIYFNLARITSYTYTAGINAVLFSTSMTFSPGAGLSPLLIQAGQAMDAVANFMLLAAAQSAFVKFFASASLVLLPLGIFLRFFSLTRKLGGMVLAGAIASSVIYPSTILISREVYKKFQPDLQDGIGKMMVAPAPDPPLVNLVCSPYMQTFVSSPLPLIGGELGWFVTFCITIGLIPGMQYFCSGAFQQIVQSIFIIIKSYFPIIATYSLLKPYESKSGIGTFESSMEKYFDPMEKFALPVVTKYSVLSTVVFLLPVIMTISLMRNLTITFGGEPQLYGLSKLI